MIPPTPEHHGWPPPEQWAHMSPQERAAFHQAWQMHQMIQMQRRQIEEQRRNSTRTSTTLVWIFVLGPLCLVVGIALFALLFNLAVTVFF